MSDKKKKSDKEEIKRVSPYIFLRESLLYILYNYSLCLESKL